jgi:broad specificity phosphatase PhoE
MSREDIEHTKYKMNKLDNLARIYLGRHCKVIWNLEGRLIGTTDLPLCEEGLIEAKSNLSQIENLGIERIICSSLKRAHQTAQIYAEYLGVPLHVCPGLREIDHGIWNGQKTDELLDDKNSDFKIWFDDPTSIPIPEGTEPIPMAQKRIVETIKKIALRYPGETLLVIMHKHIRSILRCTLLGIGLKHFRENIDESVIPFEIPREQLLKLWEIEL